MKILINQNLEFHLDDFDQKSFEETVARAEEYKQKFVVLYKLEGRKLTIYGQKIRLDEEDCCKVIQWIQYLAKVADFKFKDFSYGEDCRTLVLSIK